MSKLDELEKRYEAVLRNVYSSFFILQGKEVIPEKDRIKWAQRCHNNNRIIANTEISKEIRVSTVFIGLPNCIFESMIFGGDYDCE